MKNYKKDAEKFWDSLSDAQDTNIGIDIGEKKFEKDINAIDKNASQQKHEYSAEEVIEIARRKKESIKEETTKGPERIDRKKIDKENEKTTKESQRKREEELKRKEKEKKAIYKKTQQKQIEHDTREAVLGAVSGIQGANVDYDEIKRMSQNNIRDFGEAVHESLENDGFRKDDPCRISEIEKKIKGYIKEGKPDIYEIGELSKDFDKEEIAKAYVNVAEDISKSDMKYLEKAGDKLDIASERYERVFDRMREKDERVDKILDRVETGLGKERNMFE